MKGQRLSKGYKLMTVERLREFPGLENVSDQDARQVIESLQKLSLILFSHLQKIRN
jgi:predicted GTPase